MKLVSVPEAAEVLRISEATVRNRIKKQIWPVYDFGERSTRLDLDDHRLDAFVAQDRSKREELKRRKIKRGT